jgi:hypothetical protein
MTDDSHVRIYADCREEQLPAFRSWCITSDDPIKAKAIKDEYYRHNQGVAKALINKGFDKFTLNMYLQVGLGEEGKGLVE